MKLFIPAAVTVILTGAYLIAQQSDEDNAHQSPEQTISKPTMRTVNDEQSQYSTALHNTAQPVATVNRTESPSKSEQVAQRDKVAEVEQLVSAAFTDKGVFDLDVLTNTLSVKDFDRVISHLIENSNADELARQYKIEQSVSKNNELAAYQHQVACGQGLCALELADVPNEELEALQTSIGKLDLGSTFRKILPTDDGTSSLRVITQSQMQKVTSTTLQGSNISFGSKN